MTERDNNTGTDARKTVGRMEITATGTQRRPPRLLVTGIAVATFVAVGIASPAAVLTVLHDGLVAAFVLVPAGLSGLWFVPLFRLGSLPLRWHLLLGGALGIGVTSLLVLLLGLAGVLERSVWIVVLTTLAAVGVIRLHALLTRAKDERSGHTRSDPETDAGGFRYLWLAACPFLVLGLLAASNAPGLVWGEEGFGYDVLEYHLQLPKEYFEAGRIIYTPHNVYGNFPANVEMLYLLAMIVLDDVPDVGTTANMIHLFFAVLTVFAAWVAGREWSPLAGVVSGVAMATVGWLTYLSALAYVENGMLFFGMVAVAIIVRLLRSRTARDRQGNEVDADAAKGHLRWIALAGASAGLACGCKYTALPMIALPLGLTTLFLYDGTIRRKITLGFVFAAATLVTFSPWLIKNQLMTGNPVFPLANTVFAASPPGWSDKETEHWNRGHALAADRRDLGSRLSLLWDNLLGDKHHRFGPAIFLLAALGLVLRRLERIDLALLLIAIVQLAVWLFATHLFARFAVVLLIPLALLAGRALVRAPSMTWQWGVAGVLIAGSAWNFTGALRLHRTESFPGASASLFYDGVLPGYEYLGVVNHELPADAKILLVGDAKAFYFQRDVDYCVAFNRNPFLDVLLSTNYEHEVLEWLRGQEYTQVLVNWSEVRRLASTYGFSPPVDASDLERRFDRLSAAGLKRTHKFKHRDVHGRYVELYELKAEN